MMAFMNPTEAPTPSLEDRLEVPESLVSVQDPGLGVCEAIGPCGNDPPHASRGRNDRSRGLVRTYVEMRNTPRNLHPSMWSTKPLRYPSASIRRNLYPLKFCRPPFQNFPKL